MDKKVSARKREDKRRALFRTVWSYVLCLGAAALLFAYAFVHYDAETEANTYQVTTHLTDYALFTSRHGGITLQLSTEAGCSIMMCSTTVPRGMRSRRKNGH